MSRIDQLNAAIAKWELNNHPFYQEWKMGTLPKEALVDYSGEYGMFVATVAQAWDTLGFPDYANEERYHEELWKGFQKDLGFTTRSNRIETEELYALATKLFEAKDTAAGALYSFEAQQPNTSAVKLKGLLEHYNLTEAGREYFAVHAEDFHEVQDLSAVIEKMDDASFAKTLDACEQMAHAMWKALDGVYYAVRPVTA
ncbi:MAG: iron-containing redox enzyme family protein [Armatimonadetes bacterium]|nr:iron-containing redox enzyme family protein [Armatimonadota bacterium]